MDGACPTTSAYYPSSLVDSFHAIPHVDIDLSPSPDNFELSLDYFQAVIIWACVPLLCVICLFIIMAVYFICLCCCCCCQQHDKRSKLSRGFCGGLVILLVLVSLGMVGVGIWAEYELDQDILQSFSSAKNATDIMGDLRNTTLSFSYDTAGTQATLENLLTNLQNEPGPPSTAVNSAMSLIGFNQGLGSVFGQIQSQATFVDFGDLNPVFGTLGIFETARHWVIVAYLIVTIIFLILVILSVCFSACCKSPVCMVIMLVVFFFMTFVMWVAVGANLALLVVSGDICSGPDALIRNFTAALPANDVSEEVLDYYLICNQTCYSSPFQPFFDNATTIYSFIDTNVDSIQTYLDGAPNVNIQGLLDAASTDFSTSDMFVMDVENMTDCGVLNSAYLNVLSDLCTDGYVYSVVLFSMACGLAVFMMLILICGSFYAGLLAEGREYDDETVVYDFPNSGGPSPWDSYGTQQQYTPYRGEAFDLRTSPQTLPNEPPKYNDLSNQYGGNAHHSNGANFNSDGTVDVAIRPASRGGDIDIGDCLEPPL